MKHNSKIFSLSTSLLVIAALGIGIVSARAQTGYFAGSTVMKPIASGYMAYSFQPLYGTWMRGPSLRSAVFARQPYPFTQVEQWHAGTMATRPPYPSTQIEQWHAGTAVRPPYPFTQVEQWHPAIVRPPYPSTAIEQWHTGNARLAYPFINFIPWHPGMMVRQTVPGAPRGISTFSRAR